jgi:ABC-type Zn uptake system ZnuABC Zn-binding protein ZnuA
MQRFIILTILVLSSAAQAQSLKIATSFSVLEDLVKNIGGNKVQITNFVPRNGDAHGYQPSAQDVKALAQAKLVFTNGGGLEAWFAKLAQNAGGNAKIIELAKGLNTLKLKDSSHGEEFDPHIWWNPKNTQRMIERIRNALSLANPEGKNTYWNNALKYNQQLKNLDTWAKLEMQKIPIQNRKIVTNHDALGYLANRYGLRIIGTIIPSGSTERASSAKETAHLIQKIRQENIKAIFTENIINPKLAQIIARETGAKIAPPLYTDSLGTTGSSGETYLKAFKYNISTLVATLR